MAGRGGGGPDGGLPPEDLDIPPLRVGNDQGADDRGPGVFVRRGRDPEDDVNFSLMKFLLKLIYYCY